jgi:arylsulfatase
MKTELTKFALAALVAPTLLSQSILATFKDYPPIQRPSSFSIDQIVEKMQRNFAPGGD